MIRIKPISKKALPLMEKFLYLSVFQKDVNHPIPKSIVKEPRIALFIEDFFAKKEDYGLMAVENEKVVGMVWIRLLNGNPKGYGNIDDHTPEFAIALLPEYRNQGIGKKLMRGMFKYMKEKGYAQGSLSVQKANKAFRFYQKLGFTTYIDKEDEAIMVISL